MFKNSALVMFFFITISNGNSKPKEIKCPEYCVCDEFQKLRRATCQNKRLFSIEIGMPPQAQVLDLSYNQISDLGDKIFLEIGLTNLKLLNLSHNKVSQIHFNGFDGLSGLKTLDLSFNAIRYLLKSWFLSLSSLQELYLKGNNLKSINEEPLINLKNLKMLDLSRCGITHFQADVFTKISNLESLDLSENYLIQLRVEAIAPLENLRVLNVKDNYFNCRDDTMKQLRNYTRTKGIQYSDPCNSKIKINKNEKFQKMVLMEPKVPKKNLWIYDEDEEKIENTKIIEVCSNNATNEHSVKYSDNILMRIIELSPGLTIFATFVYGITIGLVIGCSVQMKCGSKKTKNEENCDLPDGPSNFRWSTRSISRRASFSNYRARALSLGSSRRLPNDEVENLMMSEFDLANSTPVQSRKTYL